MLAVHVTRHCHGSSNGGQALMLSLTKLGPRLLPSQTYQDESSVQPGCESESTPHQQMLLLTWRQSQAPACNAALALAWLHLAHRPPGYRPWHGAGQAPASRSLAFPVVRHLVVLPPAEEKVQSSQPFSSFLFFLLFLSPFFPEKWENFQCRRQHCTTVSVWNGSAATLHPSKLSCGLAESTIKLVLFFFERAPGRIFH
jgi:hypothetical protein